MNMNYGIYGLTDKIKSTKLQILLQQIEKILLHRESKKGATLTMAITLSILDRFAKFFHCCKEQ